MSLHTSVSMENVVTAMFSRDCISIIATEMLGCCLSPLHGGHGFPNTMRVHASLWAKHLMGCGLAPGHGNFRSSWWYNTILW